MSIDWSEQPEGFSLWLEGTNEDHCKNSGWYRRAGEVYEGAHGGQWRAVREGQFFTVHTKPDAVAWTGEGLPPVGTVCELRASKLSDWHQAEIKFASRNVIVWDWVGEPAINGLCTAYAHTVEFRPIRTPEQIAEDERSGFILDLAGELSGHSSHIQLKDMDMAKYLYDLGYRKQETP